MKNIDSVNPSPQVNPAPKITIEQKKSYRNPEQFSLLAKSPRSKPKFILKWIVGVVLVVVLVVGGLAIGRAVSLSNKIFVGKKTTFFQKIKDLIRGGNGGIRIIGEDLGQVNVLLMGIGGEGHDGPYLTDTMILAQVRPDIGEVALVSIPRDYLVDLPKNFGSRKINSAFAEGYNQNRSYDEAGQWARQAVQNISGLQVPYFAVVDFSGFEKAVDKIGGLDVNVERTFTDYSFPNDETKGFIEPLTFEQGMQHMNGERSLQFARSRHAAGIEGSDFSRSLRQQKIIQAFKEKATSLNLISDVGTINNLAGIFADHFHTNMTPGEILRLYNLTQETDQSKIVSLSLDPSTKIICPKIIEETGAYVLLPCPDKTPQDVKNFFQNVFALGKLYGEKSIVWLSNSGTDKTTYQIADKKLKDAGLTVWELPYTGPALSENVFYQANPKPATAEFIKNSLNATEASLPPKGIKIDTSKVDVIIILGENN